MRLKLLVFAAAVGLVLSGCTGTMVSRELNVWAEYDITLYAVDGKVIGHWISSDKVHSESGSNGWFFTDSATGKLMCIDGTCVLKQL